MSTCLSRRPGLVCCIHRHILQVLMIDAEGYDYNALQQIPFERMRPAFVLYEHKHLHANRAAAEQLMRQHCYAVKVLDRENTVAMALFV